MYMRYTQGQNEEFFISTYHVLLLFVADRVCLFVYHR